MARILVVDDRPANRDFIVTLLGGAGHRLIEASDGAKALAIARRERPDLIITDILLPSMDGYSFVRYLRVTPGIEQTHVIFWTATYLEHEAGRLAQICGVRQVLGKPCEPECLLRAVDATLASEPPMLIGAALPEFDRQHLRQITNKLAEKLSEQEAANRHLEKLLRDLRESNEGLVRVYDESLEQWVRALDARDREAEGHTRRVTELSTFLARAMGIRGGELAALRRGALLHDIGKLGVPDSVLHKPGPLTEEEWELMRLHPVHARRMLEPIEFLRPSLDIPYCHHEKWDGAGYPNRLRGTQIPLSARLFAVVDVWDALLSKRPYHDAWSREEAVRHMVDESGRHFDAEVVDCFLKLDLQASHETNRAEA
jgi:putative two-component system response regulator